MAVLDITKQTLAEHVKTIFINMLREVFKRHQEFTYVENETETGPDFEKTNIVITDVYTYDVQFLPAIMVRVNGATDYPISFYQNRYYLRSRYNQQGEIEQFFEYTSAWDVDVSIRIAAEDTWTREQLVDFVSITLMHWQRQALYESGVFIKKVSPGGESEETWINDYIFMQELSVPCFTEWVHEVPLGPGVSGIGFSMGLIGSPLKDGSVYYSDRKGIGVTSSAGGGGIVGLNPKPVCPPSQKAKQEQELGHKTPEPIG